MKRRRRNPRTVPGQTESGKKRLLENQEVFIIGGGPSLKGFDFARLKDKTCVAVNLSFRYVPWAKLVVFLDD